MAYPNENGEHKRPKHDTFDIEVRDEERDPEIILIPDNCEPETIVENEN